MGWKLEPVSDGPVIRLYVTNKELVIGRKDCDFVIDNNPAVSRKHAALYVVHPFENIKQPHKYPTLNIKDLGSKYGTFVNGEMISDRVINLKEDDVVTLGERNSRHRAVYEAMIVATSCLDPAAKVELTTLVRDIGGHVVGDWRPSCTHLAMNEVKVTVKAALAMTSLKPLVTLRYFADYLAKLKMNESLPDSKNYVPKSGEEALGDSNVTFDIVTERANVFRNKSFLLLSDDQYAKMSPLLSSGGARATLIDKNHVDNYAEQMLSEGVCVIKSTNPELERAYQRVEEILKEKDRRLIPESDIGLAVVNCSTQFYCNPDAKGDANSLRIQSQSLGQSVSLPVETGEIPQRSFVPDTYQSNRSSIVPPSASIKIEPPTKNESNFIKRPREEEIDKAGNDEPATKSSRTEIPPLLNLEPDVPDFPVRVKSEPISGISESKYSSIVPNTGNQNEAIDSNTEDPTQPLSPDLFVQDSDSETEEVPPPKRQKIRQDVEAIDSEAGCSRKKPKGDEIEDGNERSSKKPRLDNETQENISLEPIDVPLGFMNAKQRRRETNQNLNEDENTENVEPIKPNQLGSKFVSLVKRQAGYSKMTSIPRVTLAKNDVNVKNFKNFKKVDYAGSTKLPRVIGAGDLRPFAQHKPKSVIDYIMENKEWLDDPEEDGIPAAIKSQPENPALLADSDQWI